VKHEWYNRLRKTLPRVEPPRTGFEISLGRLSGVRGDGEDSPRERLDACDLFYGTHERCSMTGGESSSEDPIENEFAVESPNQLRGTITDQVLDVTEKDCRREIAREWEQLQRRIEIVGFAIREWNFLAPDRTWWGPEMTDLVLRTSGASR